MCNALECGPIAQAGARFDAGASAAAAGGMSATTAGMIISSLAAGMHLAVRWSSAVRRQRVPLVAALRLGFLAALLWAMPLRLPPSIQPSPADSASRLSAAGITGSINYEVRFHVQPAASPSISAHAASHPASCLPSHCGAFQSPSAKDLFPPDPTTCSRSCWQPRLPCCPCPFGTTCWCKPSAVAPS